MHFLSVVANFFGSLLLGLVSLVQPILHPKEVFVSPTPAPLVVASTTFAHLSPIPKKIVLTTPATDANAPKEKIPVKTSTPVTTPSVTPTTSVEPALLAVPTEEIDARLRKSLVNILCTPGGSGSLYPFSGSGIIIDTRGIILTNAHVAQLFLLRDYPTKDNIDCVVRTGSPAVPRYRATLLYLPPSWIEKNADQITASEGKGTGEDDYAFLLITATTNGAPLPDSFPAMPITTDIPALNDTVVMASYPAQYLGGITIERDLYITSTVSSVDHLYTVDEKINTVDAVSLGGTILSQSGSSGGGVAKATGALVGVISTQTAGSTTASRNLQAITVDYIDRSIAKHGKGGLVLLLAGDVLGKARQFNEEVAPLLTQKLISVLKK